MSLTVAARTRPTPNPTSTPGNVPRSRVIAATAAPTIATSPNRRTGRTTCGEAVIAIAVTVASRSTGNRGSDPLTADASAGHVPVAARPTSKPTSVAAPPATTR